MTSSALVRPGTFPHQHVSQLAEHMIQAEGASASPRSISPLLAQLAVSSE